MNQPNPAASLGSFGDETGAEVSLSWAALQGLGIGDDGDYPIGVQVTYTDYGSTAVRTAEGAGVLVEENADPAIEELRSEPDEVGAGVEASVVGLFTAAVFSIPYPGSPPPSASAGKPCPTWEYGSTRGDGTGTTTRASNLRPASWTIQ